MPNGKDSPFLMPAHLPPLCPHWTSPAASPPSSLLWYVCHLISADTDKQTVPCGNYRVRILFEQPGNDITTYLTLNLVFYCYLLSLPQVVGVGAGENRIYNPNALPLFSL